MMLGGLEDSSCDWELTLRGEGEVGMVDQCSLRRWSEMGEVFGITVAPHTDVMKTLRCEWRLICG
jgi:hypothetical protein